VSEKIFSRFQVLIAMSMKMIDDVIHKVKKKVKLSRYTPWWHMGGEDV
jgi:hypothetical protein